MANTNLHYWINKKKTVFDNVLAEVKKMPEASIRHRLSVAMEKIRRPATEQVVLTSSPMRLVLMEVSK